MSKYICMRCRTSLQKPLRAQQLHLVSSPRAYTSPAPPKPYFKKKAKKSSSVSTSSTHTPKPLKDGLDIPALLSKPTWSVRSLLPTAPPTQEITPKQLHHLLRLSALPLPKTPEEEASLLHTLHTQLHFVRDIQSVDTEGVEPLQSIRDETEEGMKEVTIGLDDVQIQEALGKEVVVGRNRRPRRRRDVEREGKNSEENWDVLGTAREKVEVPGTGRFFVVRSGKEKGDVLASKSKNTMVDRVES